MALGMATMQEIRNASASPAVGDVKEVASSIATTAVTAVAGGGLGGSFLLSTLARISVALAIVTTIIILTALILGPISKSRGILRTFYGEDKRHALKKGDAYNGVRLTLKQPVDSHAVRARVLQLLRQEGALSLLRVLVLSSTQYTFCDLSDEAMVDLLIHHGESGVNDQRVQDVVGRELWSKGLPLQIYVHGSHLDLMAHHAVWDGVRGIGLLNLLMGNLEKKGALRPRDLPCCLLACSLRALARVIAFERPAGTLSLTARQAHHESHYLRVPAALMKAAKGTHGLGFVAALQGLVLWALFRCGACSDELHVASTVGFKSDFWARLGSAFNHYGAFPCRVADGASPQDVARAVTQGQKRNGFTSGFSCLMANASMGGVSGSMAQMYKAIDVLIGGGPLILDPSCGYEHYRLCKFHHTVPIYVLYVTICDHVDISFQSRVPLPGLAEAMEDGLQFFKHARPVRQGSMIHSMPRRQRGDRSEIEIGATPATPAVADGSVQSGGYGRNGGVEMSRDMLGKMHLASP